MSDPAPEQPAHPARPAQSPAWPGGGFTAPGGFSVPPPPGYPAQPTYPTQSAHPHQLAHPAYSVAPGPQGYPSAYPAPAYAAATRSGVPGSTVVLLILSVVGIVATGIIGIPSAVIAALAWRQNGADPAAARKRTTTGWIVLAVNFAIGILLLIPFYIWVSNNQ